MDTRPLQIPVFRRTFAGQGAAVVGTVVTEVAVPVQIYDLSHSSFDVGLAGLAGLVPILVFGLYGGAVADAVDRRRLYLASAALTWTVTLALLAQAVAGAGSVPLILALVAVQSGGFAVSSAVRGAITPALVPRELVPAANSLTYTASTIGQVLGPLVAGVLLGLPNGFRYAYGADAILFTAALYATFRLPPLPPSAPLGRPGLRSVVDGLRFLAGRQVLLVSFLVDIAAMVLAMPTALFPQAAETRWHGGVGLLYASIAAGSVLAGLSSGWIGRVRRQGVALAAAVAVWAAAVALAGLAPALWLAVTLLVVAGAADLVSAVYRADDPADHRPGPAARPAAGRVHRGRHRRSPPRRPARRDHGLGAPPRRGLVGARTGVRGARAGRGRPGEVVLALHARGPLTVRSAAKQSNGDLPPDLETCVRETVGTFTRAVVA